MFSVILAVPLTNTLILKKMVLTWLKKKLKSKFTFKWPIISRKLHVLLCSVHVSYYELNLVVELKRMLT